MIQCNSDFHLLPRGNRSPPNTTLVFLCTSPDLQQPAIHSCEVWEIVIQDNCTDCPCYSFVHPWGQYTWPEITRFLFLKRFLYLYNDMYLTIIPRVRMDSESIDEAEGRMGYWLRGHEGERNNCFSKIQLVGQKFRDKTTLASKTRFNRHCFGFQSRRFSLLLGYNI